MYSALCCIVWRHSMWLSCDVTTAPFSRLSDVVSIRRNQYPVAVSDPPGNHSSRIFSDRLPVPSGVSEILAPCQTKPRGSIGRLVTTMWWFVITMWWLVATMWWFVTTRWWRVTTLWWLAIYHVMTDGYIHNSCWLSTTMWWRVTTMHVMASDYFLLIGDYHVMASDYHVMTGDYRLMTSDESNKLYSQLKSEVRVGVYTPISWGIWVNYCSYINDPVIDQTE